MKKLFITLFSVLALLGAFAQVNASESYIYQDTVLKDSAGKTAKVYVGVPVKVLKQNEKTAKVLINGYLFDNIVYSAKTKELEIAKLNDGFKVAKKDGNKVQLVGVVSKELLSNDLMDVWGEQEEFYFEMCTQCHAGHEVDHHSMMEWGAIFQTMKGFAKLDAEESSYLIRYLKSNASDGLVKTKH